MNGDWEGGGDYREGSIPLTYKGQVADLPTVSVSGVLLRIKSVGLLLY